MTDSIRPYTEAEMSAGVPPSVGPTFTVTPIQPPGPAVRLLLGEGVAKLDLGDNGWQVISRPKRYGMVEWQGQEPVRMQVPFMLDGLAEDRSVEGTLQYLYRITREVRPGGWPQPTVVKLAGPLPITHVPYVITAVEVGDEEIRRPSDGYRLRTAGSLHLLQYVPSPLQPAPSPAAVAQKRPGYSARGSSGPYWSVPSTPQRTHVVRRGETLWRIARSHLGNANRWREIANLNGIRDPRKVRIGTRLRIP